MPIEGKLVTKYVVAGSEGYVINAGFGKVEWSPAAHDALWFGHAWCGTQAAHRSAERLGLTDYYVAEVKLQYHDCKVTPISVERAHD
jgi:hypothetical protein